MKSVMSVNEIVELVKRVKTYLEERAEESGMDGDYAYADMLDAEITQLEGVLTELQRYNNQQLSLPFLLSSLEAVVPNLDIESLVTNLGYISEAKKNEIAKMQAGVDRDMDYIEQFKFAKDNRHEIPGFSK